MGRKAIFDVRGLKIGQKLPFPRNKAEYIYQYLNNFNRQAQKEGRPNRYERVYVESLNRLYIKRIA